MSCIHELHPDACAVCNGMDARRRPQIPGFTARYAGQCPACLEVISPGDLIRSDGDGGYVHEECY